MAGRKRVAVLTLLFVIAMIITGLGLFAPEVRDAWMYAPRRAAAQNAIEDLAQKERGYRRRNGKFDIFSSATSTSHLHALGVSDWPADSYLFDASSTPKNGLRLRALPKGDQVLALNVGAQMYISELASSGGVIQQGWVP